MERPQASLPDWRDAAGYAPLLAADRVILAWEWLRRVPSYGSAAREARLINEFGEPGRWGLHRFEDPALAAPLARPIWTAVAMNPVLAVLATPDCRRGVDFAKMAPLMTLHAGGRTEHVLLTDGLRALRLDIVEGTIREGPVALSFRVEGPPALVANILALQRFDSLVRRGRLAGALHRPEPRVERLVLVLRTVDALAAGATQRAIAADLLEGDVSAARWREDRPDLRLRAQRLVRDARACLAGGYRALLRRSAPVSGAASPDYAHGNHQADPSQ